MPLCHLLLPSMAHQQGARMEEAGSTQRSHQHPQGMPVSRAASLRGCGPKLTSQVPFAGWKCLVLASGCKR